MLPKAEFLLINKPVGWTSHDVVGKIRSILRHTKNFPKKIKVGHAGTLDPFATGLLIVGIGKEATTRLDEFKNLKKTYQATIQLGAVSDTQDITGVITKTPLFKIPKIEEVESILKNFLGTQTQTPPMYSAKKVGGKKLYQLARQGIEVERKPVEITIYEITLITSNLDNPEPTIAIEVTCSAGTYIRTLAEDIGHSLQTGAYCQELERTKIGDHTLAQAVELVDVTAENVEGLLGSTLLESLDKKEKK